MTAWIRMLSDEEAGGGLREALELARTPHGTVDNVMRVHSLRPNTLRGHVILYRAALHDDANTLPPWLGECIASYVSILNDCPYSLANHWANARHLIGDGARSGRIEAALAARRPEDAFDGRELALMRYAEKLTLRPGGMERADVDALRGAGLDDGEILEANQIVGYFNYANRCLNGLGVTTEGDVVGYYAEPAPAPEAGPEPRRPAPGPEPRNTTTPSDGVNSKRSKSSSRSGAMKRRVLERARSTVDGFLHRQCADTTLGVLSVNPEVDGYGDEFLLIRFTYDDSNGAGGLPDSLARIQLKDRLRTELQSAEVEAFPVVSFIAESEVGKEPE